MKIRQRILNLAYQTYLESKQSLFVVGSLNLDSKQEGLSVEINSVRGKPQPGVQADFLAQCRVSDDFQFSLTEARGYPMFLAF